MPKSKINWDKTEALQQKYGAGVLAIDNPSGTTFITVLDENGNYHSGGSDRGQDDETDNQNEEVPLFESEKKQSEYERMRTQIRTEILKSYRMGGGTFKNFKGLTAKQGLREMKSGGKQKLDMDFIKRALELDDDDFNRLIEKSPRLAGNLNAVQNKPISTLRRAFSPAGKQWVEDMIEDVGEDSTSSLISAIEVLFE